MSLMLLSQNLMLLAENLGLSGANLRLLSWKRDSQLRIWGF